MKIAIISDIHENAHNLILAFQHMQSQSVERIIFLGDFINAGIAKFLAHNPLPVTAIWGNNDGETVAVTKVSLEEGSNLTVGFDTFDTVEFAGRKMFLTHYPMPAKPMAKSGDFDAVFYGHNHIKHMEMVGDCLLLNPGEISAHKTGEASYAIYDTETNTAEMVVLEDSITLKTDLVDQYRKDMNLAYTESKSHRV